jgi:hypothetical protein
MTTLTKKYISTHTLDELEFHYNNHTLTEFLKELTENELLSFIKQITANDIIGNKIDILGAIRTELEYRKENKLLYPKKELTSNRQKLARTLSQKEVERTGKYISHLGVDFEKIVEICPVMMSLDQARIIYVTLKKKGLTKEEIIKVFQEDLETLINIMFESEWNCYDVSMFEFNTFVKELEQSNKEEKVKEKKKEYSKKGSSNID